MAKSADEMTSAQRNAHNRKRIEELRRQSISPAQDPGDGQRLARIMKTESRAAPRKIAVPTELRQEHLKYTGGPTGEDLGQ